MQEISVDDFRQVLKSNRNALIVGNGFSINFDSDFRNIYSLLSRGNGHLKNPRLFEISVGAVPNTKKAIEINYSKIQEHFNSYEDKDFVAFFNSAIEYAGLLKEDRQLREVILRSKHLNSSKNVSNLYEIAKLINIEQHIEKSTKSKQINHFVFFGIHPENDYHIFRAVYEAFISGEIKDAQITFCYFADDEKQMVLELLKKVLVATGFNVLKAALINIKFVDSKEIINFYDRYEYRALNWVQEEGVKAFFLFCKIFIKKLSKYINYS